MPPLLSKTPFPGTKDKFWVEWPKMWSAHTLVRYALSSIQPWFRDERNYKKKCFREAIEDVSGFITPVNWHGMYQRALYLLCWSCPHCIFPSQKWAQTNFVLVRTMKHPFMQCYTYVVRKALIVLSSAMKVVTPHTNVWFHSPWIIKKNWQ